MGSSTSCCNFRVRWFVAKPMITRIWGCVINFFPPDFTGDSLRKSIAIRAASHIIPWIYNIMFATHAFAHREHLQDPLSYKDLYYFVRIFASRSTIFGCYCICHQFMNIMRRIVDEIFTKSSSDNKEMVLYKPYPRRAAFCCKDGKMSVPEKD